jgi:hypothetical protein
MDLDIQLKQDVFYKEILKMENWTDMVLRYKL